MGSTNNSSTDYDLVVIGGGSGGLSCAKEASKLGMNVACLDFVKPSPIGTKWGLGGTCVNVGCIPKKLMHQASLLGEAAKDAKEYGWDLPDKPTHDWSKMVENIQAHVKALNWGYKVQLREKKVKYLNELGTFVGPNKLELTDKKGNKKEISATNVVISVGGRPTYPDIPGAREYGITSDDVFSLKKAPGKTLVVGASYVALECAGFLTALGYDTTVMVRSILLRGFDQDMANLIGEHMAASHTKFIHGATPSKLTRESEDGPITVTFNTADGEQTAEYDTVLFAIGRYAVSAGLNLANAGVVAENNGKFKVNEQEQTNVPNIYAVGDVLYGRLELTPVAIKTGALLAQRLAGRGSELMNYDHVASTVFTPLEYGTVGLTEVEAKERFGDENIATFHTKFKPLEWDFNKSQKRT